MSNRSQDKNSTSRSALGSAKDELSIIYETTLSTTAGIVIPVSQLAIRWAHIVEITAIVAPISI